MVGLVALLAILVLLWGIIPVRAWSPMTSGVSSDLLGVWGSSASDVFAVGIGGAIRHYDGTAWSPMTSGVSSDLHDVWGNSASDVWAVGDCGTILRYDGSAWNAMDSNVCWNLRGVWASSSSDVFAVGDGGAIRHYDGSTWSGMDSNVLWNLRRVWGSSPSDVFAVGDGGIILHYNGSAWTSIRSGTLYVLRDVWGSSSSDVFVVGDGGTVMHYDGSTLVNMASNTLSYLRGVWGSGPADVFAVGVGGAVLHYDGNGWTSMDSGSTACLRSVWSSSWFDIIAVGDSGTILHHIVTPTVSSVSPRQGMRGETLAVTISGTYLSDASSVSFGSGVTVNSFEVLSATQITASVTIDAVASAGVRKVTVTTPVATATLAGGFIVCVPLQAGFTANPTSAVVGQTIRFTKMSVGGVAPLSCQWDFTNDGTWDSTAENPTYAYSAPGSYTVVLRITGADGGTDSETKIDYIAVHAAPPDGQLVPQADFSADKTVVGVGQSVRFSNTSSGGVAPLSYQWDFTNDGTWDGTDENPTYAYPAAGAYTVLLMATGADANADTEIKVDYITVKPAGSGNGGPGCVSVPLATGEGSVQICASSGALENLIAVSDNSVSQTGKPDLVFPHGLVGFDVTGLSDGERVTLTITLPSDVPIGAQYWKYGPTSSNSEPHWYPMAMGSNDGDNVVTLSIRDGGIGDDDLTANGRITDDGGPCWPTSPAGGAGHGPVFRSICIIGIGVAACAGAGAYLIRRRLAKRQLAE